MSKMCVSNYTLCFIGKIYFCFTATTNLEIIFESCKVVGRNKWHSLVNSLNGKPTNCHSAVLDC